MPPPPSRCARPKRVPTSAAQCVALSLDDSTTGHLRTVIGGQVVKEEIQGRRCAKTRSRRVLLGARLTRTDLLIGNTPLPPARSSNPSSSPAGHPSRRSPRPCSERTQVHAQRVATTQHSKCAVRVSAAHPQRPSRPKHGRPIFTSHLVFPVSFFPRSSLISNAQPVGDPSSSSAHASTAVTRSSRSRSYSVADHARKCTVNGAPYLDKEVDMTREFVFFLRKL